MTPFEPKIEGRTPRRVAIVTSIHPNFDARIWKHARLLASNGIGVDLICPWDVENGSVQDGVTFHPFPKAASRLSRPFSVPLRILPRLTKIFRSVDIVHFHDLDLLPWMAMAAIGKTVVYDVHENYAEEMLIKEWIPKPLRKPAAFVVRTGQFLFSSVIKNIVLVAPSQEQSFRHRHFKRIYLYNYASTALLNNVKGSYLTRDDVVVFIGSQHVNNGSLLLLDIVEETIKRMPHIRFMATDRFSSQAFRKQVLDEIERRGIGNSIKLIPNVKPHELMDVLNGATIGISPNLRVPQQINGIHTKIFEYMAAGLPMVVSDLPHQVEVLTHNQCGVLAQPENPASFAVALENLVRDKHLAQSLGENGQRGFVNEYSYESQADHLISYYRQILDSRT